MNLDSLVATAARDRQYGELIRSAFSATAPTRVRAALAYATHSGVAELCNALQDHQQWRSAQKQWLVGIDYCRSDPLALTHLTMLDNSSVRIHDGAFVARSSGCAPRVSYHPKLYLFSSPAAAAAVVGSGNLSQTGLRFGIEAAASLRGREDDQQLQPVMQWYGRMWQAATPYDQIAAVYAGKYDADTNRRQPAPVEDDTVPEDASHSGQLSPEQLRQLRVCRHLWTEAGNLHKNLGPNRPGNQLMLKRNARVFFGFQAEVLPKDTLVGTVSLRYEAHTRDGCSLRFSNNAMDVLALPIPGEDGPPTYDQELLMFERVGVRRFVLTVGTTAQLANWKQRSDRVSGHFQFKGGREWGVF